MSSTGGNIQDCWCDGASGSWNLQQVNTANGQGATAPGEDVARLGATSELAGEPPFAVNAFGNQLHFVYVDACPA